jgi:phosphoglucomutase
LREHWATYGRNYYTRHDFEEVDSSSANDMIKSLRDGLPKLKGEVFGAREVAAADDFAYHDPVDGSDSAHQGLRVMFTDGSRIVYRLSGTGTAGATLRVYIERFEPDAARQDIETQAALGDLIDLSRRLARVGTYLGRETPSVIT